MFDIRRERVLLTIFVLILNIKLPALIFHLIPRIYQENIKKCESLIKRTRNLKTTTPHTHCFVFPLVRALLIFVLTPLVLPFSVSLSYFILCCHVIL